MMMAPLCHVVDEDSSAPSSRIDAVDSIRHYLTTPGILNVFFRLLIPLTATPWPIVRSRTGRAWAWTVMFIARTGTATTTSDQKDRRDSQSLLLPLDFSLVSSLVANTTPASVAASSASPSTRKEARTTRRRRIRNQHRPLYRPIFAVTATKRTQTGRRRLASLALLYIVTTESSDRSRTTTTITAVSAATTAFSRNRFDCFLSRKKNESHRGMAPRTTTAEWPLLSDNSLQPQVSSTQQHDKAAVLTQLDGLRGGAVIPIRGIRRNRQSKRFVATSASGTEKTTTTTARSSAASEGPVAAVGTEDEKVDDDDDSPKTVLSSTPPTAAPSSSSSSSISQREDDASVMLLIRCLFLVYYASLGSLLPYLPVYYHSLGHGGQIIGMLGAVKPFTTFLVAPAWGMLSDQTGQPFRILQVTFLVSLAGQLMVCLRHEAMYITVAVFITALFNAPVKSLLDSMVMDQLRDTSQYGRLRLWGQLGFGLGSSGVGWLLAHSQHTVGWPEHNSFSSEFGETLTRYLPAAVSGLVRFADKCWQSVTGYKILFFSHAALSVPTWLCIQQFRKLHLAQEEEEQRLVASATAQEVNKEAETTHSEDVKAVVTTVASAAAVKTSGGGSGPGGGGSQIGEGLKLLFHNADCLFFFFLVFVVGVSSGVIENFAYVRMREVGGTGKEMGLSRLVSSAAGAPMFWFSGPLARWLGADRVMVLSLLSYVVRFMIYGLMRNPLQGLPAEALRGVTFAAFWSTGTIYARAVSPDGLHATMLMFLNAMYGGLGQSVGAVLGGKMQHRWGTVQTFLYAAAADLSFVCLVVAYLSIRTESNFRDPKPIVAQRTRKTESESESDPSDDDASKAKSNAMTTTKKTTTETTRRIPRPQRRPFVLLFFKGNSNGRQEERAKML